MTRTRTAKMLVGWASGLAFAWSSLSAGEPYSIPTNSAPGSVSPLSQQLAEFEKASKPLAEIQLVADQQPAANSSEAAAAKLQVSMDQKGSSATKQRQQAINEIPWAQLTPQSQQRVQGIISELSYYRRLPSISFPVEPDAYQFFIRYPDVAVSIWRAMGISEMKLWQTGPNEYEGDANDGTVGIIDVLYRGQDKQVLVCKGSYQGPLLNKPISATSVVLLQTSYFRDQAGQVHVSHTADLYVSFPSQTVETVAKILSPVTNSMVDKTFTEMSLFLRMMSVAMARRPAWVDRIEAKMEGVPDLRKTQLLELTARIHDQERVRMGLPPLEETKIEKDRLAKEASPMNESVRR